MMLDDIDMEIIGYLSEDARISNREIGQRLGLAEGTIRARVRRMVDDKCIRFTALTRELDVPTPTMCYVGLRVDLPKLDAVAATLSEIANVRFVATTIGRFDILSIVIVESVEALTELVAGRIMSIDGVRRSYTNISTKTIKYDYRWGKVG